ncbi:hypothetical protein QYM36_003742 [Artemia franciscana]|uniref:Centrosomal protein of 131 kDa n=1 Tax=Artemia franciscana TaxID=6661 RepID=A0AA88IC49_ARTSF|nr:hypothetical protein QYM36_003742 [Artemia franciscana]
MALRPQSSKVGCRKDKSKSHTLRTQSAPKKNLGGLQDSSLALSGSQVSLSNRVSAQRSEAWNSNDDPFTFSIKSSNISKTSVSEFQSNQSRSNALSDLQATVSSSYSSLWSDEQPIPQLSRSNSYLPPPNSNDNTESVSEARAVFGSNDSNVFATCSSSSTNQFYDSKPNSSMDNNVSRTSSSVLLQNHVPENFGLSQHKRKSRKRKTKAIPKQIYFQTSSSGTESTQSFGQIIERKARNFNETFINSHKENTFETIPSDYSCLAYHSQILNPADIPGNIRPASPLKKEKNLFEETEKLLTNLKSVLEKCPVVMICDNDSGLGSTNESSKHSPHISRERTPTPSNLNAYLCDLSHRQDCISPQSASKLEICHDQTMIKEEEQQNAITLRTPQFLSPLVPETEPNYKQGRDLLQNGKTELNRRSVTFSPVIFEDNIRNYSSMSNSSETTTKSNMSDYSSNNPEHVTESTNLKDGKTSGNQAINLPEEERTQSHIKELQAFQSLECSSFQNKSAEKQVNTIIENEPDNGKLVTKSELPVEMKNLLLGTRQGPRKELDIEIGITVEKALYSGKHDPIKELDTYLNTTIKNTSHVEKQDAKTDLEKYLNTTLNDVSIRFDNSSKLSDQPVCHEKLQTDERKSISNSNSKNSFEIIDVSRPKTSVTLGSSSFEEKSKLREIFSFLEDVETTNRATLKGMADFSIDQGRVQKYSMKNVSSMTPDELCDEVLALQVLMQEKDRRLSILTKELSQERELATRASKNAEKELRTRLATQKTQYEAANARLQATIDQLQTEKQEQQIKISTLSRELESTKKKYEENRKTTEERHLAEIKRIRASFTAAQRQQRSRWLSEKTNHIKEMTVRGLEPELHRLMDQHKQELDTIRTLHRAELQRLQDTLTSNNLSQIENMKCQFQSEKDAACAKERESFQTKLEREINDLERSYMERHTRLEAELNRERDRASSELARIQQEHEDYIRKLQEKFSREKAYLAEEADSELKLTESKNQMQIKSLSDTLRREKEEALDRLNESYEQKVQNLTILNSNLSSKLQQGEKEAKMMQENFADEMSKMRSHQESQHEQTLKNLKEKFRSEISELEARIDEQKAKILNLRTNLSTKEEEIASLRVSFSLRTKELEEAQTVS